MVGAFGFENEFFGAAFTGAGLDLLADDDEISGVEGAVGARFVFHVAVTCTALVVQEFEELFLLVPHGEHGFDVSDGAFTFAWGDAGDAVDVFLEFQREPEGLGFGCKRPYDVGSVDGGGVPTVASEKDVHGPFVEGLEVCTHEALHFVEVAMEAFA